MRIEDMLTREFIDYAQGSCASVQEALCAIEAPDREDEINWQMVDDEIFRCETCSWWCETGEQDDDGNCEDCSGIVYD